MSARVSPFYCPYCGEQDLRPHDDMHGGWECHSCIRVFSVRFIGLLDRVHLAGRSTPAMPGPAHVTESSDTASSAGPSGAGGTRTSPSEEPPEGASR